jgi:hypothetical protein
MRDCSREFPVVHDPRDYTSARVWHCGYKTLAPLAAFVNLRSLEIATFPDLTLEPIAGLSRLESLSIIHMPQVADLGPLSGLKMLKRLSLRTLPSWDTSGRVTEVRSLAPLIDLPCLTDLELFGVRPPDRSVDDLIRIGSLLRVSISKYPRAEIERLRDEVARRAVQYD